jgi:hypothetical protein
MVVVVVGTRSVAAAIPPSIPYAPFLSPIFLKESTKMDRYQSGFGGTWNDIGSLSGFYSSN